MGRGSVSKVDDVTPSDRQIVRSPQRRAQHVTIATADNNKMAAIRYYGNDTTTTKWRLHVTIATLPTTIIWQTGVTEDTKHVTVVQVFLRECRHSQSACVTDVGR